MIVMTGFNASHKIIFQQAKDLKMVAPKDFCGYDLGWLATRSSYRFTPNNHIIKLESDLQAFATQIKELPNVLLVDYQGLILRRIDQKLKNDMDSRDLKSLLKLLFPKKANITEILKVDQDMVALQRICHEQSIIGNKRVDMTEIMRYSINDTVCLMRAEDEIQFLRDQITNQMEAF
jgi:hypothetical protein